MADLRIRQAHHLGKLHAELLAAYPALAAALRVEGPAGPRRVKAAGSQPGNPVYETLPAEPPDTVHLSWPDGRGPTEEQVRALVAAHDPSPPPVPVHPLDEALALKSTDLEAAVGKMLDHLRRREGLDAQPQAAQRRVR
jgi:hypothetical protein